MAARHYDPATGRFLQVDPLGIDAAELYAYAANNPYVFWDPTGLIPAPITIGDVATIGAETFIPFVSAYNAYERGDYGTAALDATLDVVGIAATGGFGYAAFRGFRLAQRVDRVFDATGGGSRVLLDSSVVPPLRRDPTLGGRLKPGEVPGVSFVTRPELRNAASSGSLRGVPAILDDLPVLSTRPSLNTRINVRGQLPAGRGRFGDGIIGGQAIEGRIPLITDDPALAGAVRALGGVAR